MEKITEQQVSAGQGVYGKFTLSVYDKLVLGASCSWLWKCRAERMLDQYNTRVSDNHLDVGVGSGYFLDHCRFPSSSPRVVLMDLNESSLSFTAERIARYSPQVCRRNVLEDMSVNSEKFDSVGMNLLLHCVPGSLEYKGRIFDHCKEVMNDGAVLFGATIINVGTTPNFFARKLIDFYNKKGIFSNKTDSQELLRKQLEQRFSNVAVEVHGCIAMFSAVK